MKNKVLTLMLLGAVMSFGPAYSFADETVGEKAEEAVKDTNRAMKKGARAIQDKSCEVVNGKTKCIGKKLKNKAKNAADKAEDVID